jgi:hypothetical protein
MGHFETDIEQSASNSTRTKQDKPAESKLASLSGSQTMIEL